MGVNMKSVSSKRERLVPAVFPFALAARCRCLAGLAARCSSRAALAFLLAPLAVVLAPAAHAFYDDASVRSILLNRERAEKLDAPLVLLAHETRCRIMGNGARITEEHRIWYVDDAKARECQAIRNPRIRLDLLLERIEIARCRIYRGTDTLEAAPESWSSGPVAGWPDATRLTWIETTTELPQLKRGDLVEIAYAIHNRWTSSRPAAHWEVFALSDPLAPTIERHVIISSPPVVEGRAIVIGDGSRVVRHYGQSEPELELLTGNLPRGPEDPLGLGAPRLLFSAEENWELVRRCVAPHFTFGIGEYERGWGAAGDSIVARARTTRERMAEILALLERRSTRLPLSPAESEGFPRLAPAALQDRAGDRLDRALLAAGLAAAAHVPCSVFFGASSAEAFRADFASPQQFDRVLVGVPLIEEGRYLVLDPWEKDLASAEKAAAVLPVLFGISDDVARFQEVGPDGLLHARTMP